MRSLLEVRKWFNNDSFSWRPKGAESCNSGLVDRGTRRKKKVVLSCNMFQKRDRFNFLLSVRVVAENFTLKLDK
jgi:hypothetical protein